MANGVSDRRERLALRWEFLEKQSDACSVVTGRMEVIYVNSPARSMVGSGWFGCRCWEVFPVGDESCAARCPAVKAVHRGNDIVYCEETISAPDGSPMTLGVAVIPVRDAGGEGERAVLLLRPRPAGISEPAFLREVLERAREVRALCSPSSPERSYRHASAHEAGTRGKGPLRSRTRRRRPRGGTGGGSRTLRPRAAPRSRDPRRPRSPGSA